MNDEQHAAVIGRIERPGQTEAQVNVDMPSQTVTIEQRRSPLSIAPDTVRLPFDAVLALAAQLILAGCAASGTVKFSADPNLQRQGL